MRPDRAQRQTVRNARLCARPDCAQGLIARNAWYARQDLKSGSIAARCIGSPRREALSSELCVVRLFNGLL